MRLQYVLLGLVGIAAFACSSAEEGPIATIEAGTESGGMDGGLADVSTATDGTVEADVACSPPDVLIVLDRTLAMARRPDGTRPLDTPAEHAESKWAIATKAVKAATAAPADVPRRFGLELFPHDPGGAACVTLAEAITGKAPTNTQCEEGDLAVAFGTGAGTAVAAALDPEATRLCGSTPLGGALSVSTQKLAIDAVAGRGQLVVFITDGNESCQGDALQAVQDLAAAGISTHVVGFGQKGVPDASDPGLNFPLLNSLACAGKTAKDFDAACEKSETGTGYVAKNPGGARIFYAASTADDLAASLKSITDSACCGCGK